MPKNPQSNLGMLLCVLVVYNIGQRTRSVEESSFGIRTRGTCCTPAGKLSLRQFVLFATALVWEGVEGETSHSILTWPTAKLSPD